MKKFLAQITGALAVLALSPAAGRAKPGWTEDYDKALAQAKAEKKLVLVDFTGSDWCGWCIKLDREVFSKPEFKAYADKNLVLLEVDFPRGKEQTPIERKQNQEPAIKYTTEGFPTIVVLDEEGKQVGVLGYTPGGPAAFI